ncbi:MAG TPA: glycoside hydrolase family 3 N-terminal domain-containing protein [Longimicrobiales bacterium]
MRTGRLLFPALRWDDAHGFDHEAETIDVALELGTGGFILFGGEAAAVAELTAMLRRRAGRPLLIGADLERGAGQQFRGATPLPPVAALGALDDLDVTRRAGELTAREAVALGVNWVYAPVADVDLEPRNPIVGTRAFGADAERAAAHVAAWIDGCRAGGALSCAKHFPGHGRTTTDSHVELPRVDAGRDALEVDLVPFRAAIRAGVDSLMTAHVAYPALDPSGSAATLSPTILTGMLRDAFGFDGLVVTDALIMEGVLEAGHGEAKAAVRAVAAGCDALLYPRDIRGVAEAVAGEIGRDVPEPRAADAIRRIEAAAERAEPRGAGAWGRADDRAWALDIATRSLRPARGRPELPAREVRLVTVDDDVGGPYPPGPRDAFAAALRAAGVAVDEAGVAPSERPTLVAVYADIRAWKGRPGISAGAREAVATALAGAGAGTVVLFGHPRLAAELPGNAPVLAAWGGEPLMQEAAARWLAAGGDR